jgi:hypothetical protein
MTLNRIVYNILNQLQGGNSHQSNAYSRELITEWVLQYRALFARRDHDRGGLMREFEQTITLAVQIDATMGQTNLKTGFTYRSEPVVPIPVRLKGSDGIIAVTSENGAEAYPVISSDSARWMIYNAFTKNDKRAYYSDRRIHVVTDKFINTLFEETNEGIPLSSIDVTGVFQDPREVFYLQNPTAGEYTGDEEFPVPADIAQQIVAAIMATEAKIISGTIKDETLDGQQEKQ